MKVCEIHHLRYQLHFHEKTIQLFTTIFELMHSIKNDQLSVSKNS